MTVDEVETTMATIAMMDTAPMDEPMPKMPKVAAGEAGGATPAEQQAAQATAVPEPGAAIMLALGGILAFWRKCRRSKPSTPA